MQTISQTEGRYQARPGNPPYLYDSLKDRTDGTFITFKQAVNRAYILNRFSTGSRI